MSVTDRIRVHTRKDVENARAVVDAMTAISKATNTVPVTRLEWLLIAFIASQTIGNVALLIIALRGLR